MTNKCLNCETELKGYYCHNCGQKSSTHRITFAKFLQHDLLHGILHLDKGILYTIKTLLYTPGYAAKSFINGKRVMHYNIFALFVIIIGLKTLIDLQNEPTEVFDSVNRKQSDELINGTIHHYYKLFYFLCIPLISIFSFMLMRKLNYNFVEHVVLNCFLFSGGFFYALILSLFSFLTKVDTNLYWIPLMILYFLLGYYQINKGLYQWYNWLWRSLLTEALFLATLLGLMTLIIIIFYNGSFEGRISI